MAHLSPHAYCNQFKYQTVYGCSIVSRFSVEDLTGSTSVRSITKEFWLNFEIDPNTNAVLEWIEMGGYRGLITPDINTPFPPSSQNAWNGHFYAYMKKVGSNYVYRESPVGTINPTGEHIFTMERTSNNNEWVWKINDSPVFTLTCNFNYGTSISAGIEIQDDTMFYLSGTSFRYWLYKDSNGKWIVVENPFDNDQNGFNGMNSTFYFLGCDTDNNYIEFTHN